MRKRSILVVTLIAATLLLLTACGAQENATIRVSSKDFTEQYILGNMYKLILDDAGFDATYTSVGGTAENHEALMADQIDIYPEYTGTALLTQLEMQYDSSMSADDVYNTVSQEYADRYDLTLLDPTAFNNTYCLTLPRERAEELGITTVSDLSQKAGDLVFGTTQEFTEREDGLPGLKEVYGGFNFQEVLGLDPGLLYSGLEEGDIDVTTCFGTDGQIAAYDLLVLEDDKGFWPPYPVAPVVRSDVLEEHPEIASELNELSAVLDDATMSQLNWEVAGNGREADEVAREFLEQQGLISSSS